ncbi:MAG: DNA polymerase III subunit epsilon [Gaiellaceae bacterium]|nr:MAG: DNA polymerase III subunit epsilon [Gaiellaceae bacterium]
MIRLGGGARSWREVRFAVLDFEATGLDLERDHVLSFGVVPVERGRVRLADAVYRVVRPPITVPAASIRVHGIRPSELERAPRLEDVLDELVEALRDRVLVAHAAGVELGFLRRIRRQYGRPRVRRAIDVLDLADELARRKPTSPAPPSERLAVLAAAHGVPVARTHHAFSDALTTAQLFLVLATRLEHLGAGRVRDLRRAGRLRARGALRAAHGRSESGS